jgi:hypoxanthine phosphoribosyltransferase
VAADPSRKPIMLDWPAITGSVDRLADSARADGAPDVVVGVLRGGVVPAVLIAHRLGVRAVRAIEVVHTVGDGVDAAKTAKPTVYNAASLGELAGCDVLVVDDIAGSGDTIAATVDLVGVLGAVRVRTAVCVVNAANWRRPQRPQQALTYLGVVVEGWVIFPWESQ